MNTDMRIVIDAVNNASNILKQVQKDLENFNEGNKKSQQSMKKFIEDNRESIQTLRNTAAIGFATIGAAVGAATYKFGEFEKQMSEAKAVLGLFGDDENTKKQYKELTDLAIKLGAESKFTAKEAADGITILGQAGFSTTEVMQSLKGTMDLAAATNISIADSADIASSVLRQYGISASDTSRVMDVLAKTSIDSNAEIMDLSESFKYFGPTAKVMGISLEESAAAIGILANSGIKGSTATRALSTSLINLSKPTKQMADAMDKLGFSAFDQQGDFIGLKGIVEQLSEKTKGLTMEQKAAALGAIFGSDAFGELSVLMDAGAEAIDNFTTNLENAGGTTDKMARVQMDNMNGAIELMMGSFDSLAIVLGSVFAPMIKRAAQIMVPIIDTIKEIIASNPVLSGTITILIGGLLGLVTVLLSVALAIPTLLPAITLLKGSFISLRASITGPIGLVIAAIGLLYIAWQTNFLGIQDVVKQVLGWAMPYISQFWEVIKAGIMLFGEAWKEFWDRSGSDIKNTLLSISIIVSAFADMFVSIIKYMREQSGPIWSGLFFFMKHTLYSTFELIKGILQGALSVISGLINIFGGLLSGDRKRVWEGVKQVFWGAVFALQSIVKSGVDGILNIVGAVAEGMKESGYNAIKMLGDGIMSGIDYVKNAVGTVASTIKQYLGFASPTEMGAASDSDRWAPNLMKMFADGMAGGIPLIRDQASSVAENIRLGFDKLKYIDIKGPMKEKLDSIKQSLSNFRDATGQQLPEIVQKYNDFKQGVSDALSKLKTDYDKKVSDIASKAREVQNTIADLNKQMTSDTNSDQLSIAQKYVEEQQKVEEIQKEIADKQKEKEQDLLDGGTTTSQGKYDEELAQLQEKLATQQRIVSDNAFIETEYATQYAEAKKQADMDELTRFVYLTQQRMTQRQMEFEDKKAKLTQELIALIAQQAQVRIEYESSREAIERTMDQASVAYYERLENQKAWTKKATDDMVSYFNNVTDAINDMLAAQSQSGGGGGGIYRAFGGMVTDHDVQTARYAVGGIVQGANGIDRVPAYLSAGELVLNRAQQSNLAGQLGSNNRGGITLIVNVDSLYGEDDDYVERIGNKLVNKLRMHTGFESF